MLIFLGFTLLIVTVFSGYSWSAILLLHTLANGALDDMPHIYMLSFQYNNHLLLQLFKHKTAQGL